MQHAKLLLLFQLLDQSFNQQRPHPNRMPLADLRTGVVNTRPQLRQFSFVRLRQ
jgi:hypothetical protein